MSADANLNQLWARVLVEQLYRAGLRQAVISPGSRSGPLALALDEHPGIGTRTILDERSAAFFALGMAKESGAPAAALATSGTAGANFYPAVVEAAMAHVPLLLLTADRPPELHGWGALQTIPQQRLFGEFARWFVDLGVPEPTGAALDHLRASAARAVATALHSPRGPVQINAPFREPLAPLPDPGALPLQELRRGAMRAPGPRIVSGVELPDRAELERVRQIAQTEER
ncbi:MAG TPA: 2-succinyl-5-enolpyruvyl-6-hydroxy-3-cyclohexene-1-carboxylic-acid synthase, partial [Myxococcaceae bacterium]|nr:2-succinyl-5-enolpyruvyl-6-hydroxy-3-cyclohexene-1-carboxylic-acid synthase [Myxococcaceae bacterium]